MRSSGNSWQPIQPFSRVLAAPARDASDPWIYRLVVLALGLTAVFVVVGVFVLKALKGDSVTIPDALVVLGSAAIAALSGLLAPSPIQS